MLEFIKTVIGQRLCNLAESALVKYTHQKDLSVSVRSVDVESTINNYAERGYLYVDSINVVDDWFVLVFRK